MQASRIVAQLAFGSVGPIISWLLSSLALFVSPARTAEAASIRRAALPTPALQQTACGRTTAACTETRLHGGAKLLDTLS